MLSRLAFAAICHLLGFSRGVSGYPAATSEGVLFDRLEGPPDGWHQWGEPLPSTPLKLRLATRHESDADFQRQFLEISDPSHARYGQYLTVEELDSKLRPRNEVAESLTDWLSAFGVAGTDIQQDREWITFTAEVSQINNLLNTTFYWFQDEVGHLALRTTEYWVPASLSESVDLIHPTTSFPRFPQPAARASSKTKRHELWSNFFLEANSTVRTNASINATANGTSCNSYITPACIRSLYNITTSGFNASSTVNNSIATVGFLENYPAPQDLVTFQKSIDMANQGTKYTFIGVNGDVNRENDSTVVHAEGDLDVQYTIALSGPVSAYYISTAGRAPLIPDLDQPNADQSQVEPYLELIDYLLNLTNSRLPYVLSISYGENEQEIPPDYARKVCDGFMQLGSRGVSVLVGSGDKGPGTACQTNNGTNATAFTPYFPASCPYVTAVGGTTGTTPEKAARFSGGGFSNLFSIPSYQQGSVAEYLKGLGATQQGLYNASGRGIPDVAAQGNNFQIYSGGTLGYITGTSSSVPAFASIIALLNNALLQSSRPVLGFLNPWLYSTGRGGLNDITMGGSTGCGNMSEFSKLPAPVVPYASWNATQGWDPVTGLGTPNFGKLLQTVNLTTAQVVRLLRAADTTQL